jgi:hypothetical protein
LLNLIFHWKALTVTQKQIDSLFHSVFYMSERPGNTITIARLMWAQVWKTASFAALATADLDAVSNTLSLIETQIHDNIHAPAKKS